MTIKWNSSILAEVKVPGRLSFTDKQLVTIKDILEENTDVSDNWSIFGKLVGLGYIEEYKVSGKYQYLLSEGAEIVLQQMVDERLPKKSKWEIVQANACGRCYGKGYIPEFGHVQGGVCFECNGTGKRP